MRTARSREAQVAVAHPATAERKHVVLTTREIRLPHPVSVAAESVVTS